MKNKQFFGRLQRKKRPVRVMQGKLMIAAPELLRALHIARIEIECQDNPNYDVLQVIYDAIEAATCK